VSDKSEKLLDRMTERLLERLRLAVRARSTAVRQGSHRSTANAGGLEFADHRDYVAGDDVRRIDWKAFARHRELSIREFQEERDARVYLLADFSASMTRGAPPKVDVVRRLLAAFAYVGMRQFDAVEVIPFAAHQGTPSRRHRDRSRYVELERWLLAQKPAGTTSFKDTVREFAAERRPRGLVLVVSDLMATQGWDEGFRLLGGMGHELRLVRVTCKEDDEPGFSGELELHDSETDAEVRIRMDKELVAAYRAIVREHVEACRKLVERTGGRFVEAPVELSTEQLVKKAFFIPTNMRAVGGAK
jgi:uncharacterized protein (DUF58 family)